MRVFLVAAMLGGLCLAMEAQNILEKAQKARVQRRALTVEEATEGTVEQQERAAGSTASQGESKRAASVPAPAPAPPHAPVRPTVQAAPPGPPQKNLTGQEFALIHVGTSAKEVMTALGPPSSRVIVPDDDDHLWETWQYRVHGLPAATIRIDNGRVAQIEAKLK